jgi:hypothetical protein
MMTTFQVLTEFWNERSPAWLIILVAIFIYTLAVVAHGVSRRQIVFFVVSAVALVLALASPPQPLARYVVRVKDGQVEIQTSPIPLTTFKS